jgi:hypothetical protein
MGDRAQWAAALAVLLTLAFTGCRGEGSPGEGSGQASPAKRVDFQACRRSSDCVIEKQKDCCPCNAGGQEVAVHKDAVGAYRAAIAARCSGALLCPQVYLCDEEAAAVCRAGRCELGRGQPVRAP